ncbi:LOW QUALITY PROTEIN: probable C-mannosyltransferase DPY19L2 [Pongo abelii]|uniref:LOW QUALITY PROTEIN: probable C-mannosyltransferase DPY19L2 n=1 Tax=Pongo abelii TaxID=9601 RepID=UPI0023E7EC58|nr:LOW QUALITY PROTEIN: probable C-mannosyltransferase DPY19L2 [Pongo abelii]
MGIMNLFGLETKTCWNVTRIEPLNEVQSCEGLGDPACFYVGVVFILNGLMMGLFFMYGAYLSGTQLGGLITALCCFFNHGEATRVMWTPPLRESFSCPFLVLQMYTLTLILRTSSNDRRPFIALCLSNVAFMLPWQFAQFIRFTQIASLFPMYVVGYIKPSKFRKIIYLNMAIILKEIKFKNGISELNFWESKDVSGKSKNLIQGSAWWCGTIILKFLTSKILGVSDHIRLSDLTAARILRYTDFDTLIYTCAPKFDFMEKAAEGSLLISTTTTGPWEVLPGYRQHSLNAQGPFSQLVVSATRPGTHPSGQWAFFQPRADAVFAGAMPTMASVKLSTLHPIVNHSHYEDADLRAQTKIVCSTYSRKSAKEVRDKLLELHVNYCVLEEAWCVVRTKPGCSMLEIWDVEDPSNAANPPLCSVLLKDARPYFTTVFQNSVYRVLKVN